MLMMPHLDYLAWIPKLMIGSGGQRSSLRRPVRRGVMERFDASESDVLANKQMGD